MSLITPKPYRKLCRLTNKFVWVYPEPKEFMVNTKAMSCKTLPNHEKHLTK